MDLIIVYSFIFPFMVVWMNTYFKNLKVYYCIFLPDLVMLWSVPFRFTDHGLSCLLFSRVKVYIHIYVGIFRIHRYVYTFLTPFRCCMETVLLMLSSQNVLSIYWKICSLPSNSFISIFFFRISPYIYIVCYYSSILVDFWEGILKHADSVLRLHLFFASTVLS